MPVLTVPLRDISAATPRSKLLTLDVRDQPFGFLAGQAVLLATHGHGDRRPYSIASSPERTRETGSLELLIGTEEDGSLGPHLSDVRVGTLVDIEGPLGTFVFPDAAPQRHLLFVAGGTGIAPLRAMLDHALRQEPQRSLAMLYSARRAEEFAFLDELLGYTRAGRLDLRQTVTRDDTDSWSGRRGRIDRTHVHAIVRAPQDTLCFVCGPRAMVHEAVSALRDLGVPPPAIRTESWSAPEHGAS